MLEMVCPVIIATVRRATPLRFTIWALALSTGSLFGGHAFAQAGITSWALDEIIVSAQKRPERAQDIPMSLTTISSGDIEQFGASDFQDLLLSIPGISYSAAEWGLHRYSIRGISSAAANPTVGIYFNDVSLVTVNTSFSGAADPALIDIERIEVLGGPQGTLYGGSAMGGAIKYVTRKPAMDAFSIEAGIDVGAVDHGGTSYGGDSLINVPLIDHTLALRMGGAYRLDAGYVSNIPNASVQVWSESATMPPEPFAPVTYPSQSTYVSRDFNQRATSTGRLSILYSADESLKLTGIATFQHTNQANPDEFFTNLPEFENTARFPQPTYEDLGMYSVEVTKQWQTLQLVSLTGLVDRSIILDRDFSLFLGMLNPLLLSTDSSNKSNTDTRTYSEEVRLSSTATPSAVKWTVGALYSHQHDDFNQVVDTVDAGRILDTGTDITYSGDLVTRISQIALFGDLTYTVLHDLDLNVGARWFDIRQLVDGGYSGYLNGGQTSIDGRRSTNVGVTPKASVAYRPLDDHLLYFDAGRGFRAGGPNPYNIISSLCNPALARLGLNHSPDSYDPDSLWTYEIGSKNVWHDIPLIVNGAIYYTNWLHIQQEVTLPTCAFPFVGNVGAATVKGAELSAEFQITPSALIGGNASYTDTRVTKSGMGVPAQIGQPLLDTPLWMGSAYAAWRFLALENWNATARVDFEYHGSNLRQFQSTASVSYSSGSTGEIPDATQIQAAYHVINAGLQFVRGRTRIRLYVDNVGDAAPYLDFRRAPGFSAADTIRPRTIGLSTRTQF